MPAEHDGSTFTFDLSFSENVAAGYARIRDHAFSVNGANIKKARRKTQGSNQNWTVTVDPTGNGGVSITLPETTNCNNAGAICTDDGRKLNHSTSDSVQGPVGISVSDARVEEAAGAVLAFAVTLSRAASGTLTVGLRHLGRKRQRRRRLHSSERDTHHRVRKLVGQHRGDGARRLPRRG